MPILSAVVKYRALARTDVKVSAIGLGCGGFGGVGSAASLFGKGENEQQAIALMDHAVALGINYFDTANSYGGGRSEEFIGRWMKDRGARDSIVLATKVFNPMGGDPNSGGLSRRAIVRAVEDSLRRLQTDRIDLYMAHDVDPAVDLEETMRAFDDLVRGGKVLHLGFCNIEAWRVVKSLWVSERIGGARLACVQNEYNLLHREADAELLPMLAGEGVSFVAFSPMAGGWLTGKYRPGASPPEGSRMTLRPEPYLGFQNAATYATIDRLAASASEFGASLGAVALAWAMSNPLVTAVLAAPRNLDQFIAVEEALSLNLADAGRARLSELAAGVS